MAQGFDFREMFGGMGMAVGHDPHLADGIEKDQAAADLQASSAKENLALAKVIAHVGNTLTLNAAANGLCPACLLNEVIRAIATAAGQQSGPDGRQHVIAAVEAALNALKRGGL
jgi:hypothetical protein